VWTELGVVSRLLPRHGSPRKRLRYVDFFRKLFWRHFKFSSRIDSLLLFLFLLLLTELFFRQLNQFFFSLGKIPVKSCIKVESEMASKLLLYFTAKIVVVLYLVTLKTLMLRLGSMGEAGSLLFRLLLGSVFSAPIEGV